jgi:hypothetical protein
VWLAVGQKIASLERVIERKGGMHFLQCAGRRVLSPGLQHRVMVIVAGSFERFDGPATTPMIMQTVC